MGWLAVAKERAGPKTGPDLEFLGGGGYVGSRGAETSNATNLLVDGSCICIRQGGCLLNRGPAVGRSRETRSNSDDVSTFGFAARRWLHPKWGLHQTVYPYQRFCEVHETP